MKISSLVIGKGKGSAGNITVVQLKGQTILKQKASIVANPNTVKQQEQRKAISRAVIVWQLLGNSLKSGWTSLLPFCSQYNTFTSENSQFFKDATFTRATFKAMDLINSTATKGKLGILQSTVADNDVGVLAIDFSSSQLANIAKVGDIIKVVGSDATRSEMSSAEFVVTPQFLASPIPGASFELGDNAIGTQLVYAVWLETADGKDSTTSKFVG